eukprot:gene8933-10585_t
MGKEPLFEYHSKELKALILRDLMGTDDTDAMDDPDPVPSPAEDKGDKEEKEKGKAVAEGGGGYGAQDVRQ